jgi:DNA-binding transcriptional LysR family regulator
MIAHHLPDIGARHLAAVLAVAENRSFVAAAAQLHMSQPALTRTIKRVEDVLGVRLFERATRTVRLTEAGREFVAVAQRIVNDLRLTAESMRDLAEQKRGQVIVSAIMSVATGVLPSAVAAYRRARPAIEVHVRDGVHGGVVDDVKSGAADFGVTYLHDIPDGFRADRLGPGYFDLVAGRDTPFGASGRTSIRFEELEGVALVSLPPESQTRRVLDGAAAMRGVALTHSVVVSQIPTLLSFVRAGVGVGLAPSAAIIGETGDDLVRLTLRDPRISLDIGVLRLAERALSPAADGLLAQITARWPAD